jgi:hypothetical protein
MIVVDGLEKHGTKRLCLGRNEEKHVNPWSRSRSRAELQPGNRAEELTTAVRCSVFGSAIWVHSWSAQIMFPFWELVFRCVPPNDNASELYSGGDGFESWLGILSALFEVFRVLFFLSLRAIAGVALQMRSWSLPSEYFPIHYSPIILSFDPILSEQLTA